MEFRQATPLILTLFVLFFGSGCTTKKVPEYKRDDRGYYYKLHWFEEAGPEKAAWKVARVSVAFKTQSDSVFWDSYNNLGDNFFVRFSHSLQSDLLTQCVSRFTLRDSVTALIPVTFFFREQFNAAGIPFFSVGDSVVKVDFKISELMDEKKFTEIQSDLERKEMGRMIVFYGSKEAVESARDSLGFYWVEKPEEGNEMPAREGDLVTIAYEGHFLNGRFLEKSPPGFELVLGTPDQLLKGINYVIQRLKVGQNAKIILPSRLAFGEKGSSNGIVPPFTPLLYEVKVNNIKHQDIANKIK